MIRTCLVLCLVGLSLSHRGVKKAPVSQSTYPADVGLNPLAEYSYSYQPRHVHIAYGENTTEVVVTWSTPGNAGSSIVNWGTEIINLDKKSVGYETVFEDATKKNKQYIRRAHLFGLAPDTSYFYQVGSPYGWSAVFGFRTVPAGTAGWPLRFAAYGDLGVVNAKSLTRIQREAHTGKYDMVLHVGDFAYDLYEDSGRHGDEFMNQIQPIAAYLPYMVCPGNHEYRQNFLQYRNRFTMPNHKKTEGIYYSYNVGPVHFVSVSTEVYHYGENQQERVEQQYKWLEQDLQKAADPDHRKERPWIVIYGHRPMYCSNSDGDDCTRVDCRLRVGMPGVKKYGLEQLLNKYKVDVAIWAHEHSYERFYPMYNYTYYKEDDPYVNPKAPVHITTGSAGCREIHDNFLPDQPAYSAKRFVEYGYARFTVHNFTHLHVDQVNATTGEVLDEVMIVKDAPVSLRWNH